MGRDLPKLGAEPEPIDGPSVHHQKIQIALSIYQSILAQAALRTARITTHIVTSKSHFPSTRWLGLPFLSVYRFHLAPLVTKCHQNQGEKDEEKRLELERLIAPALCLVQQARLDTYSPARRRVARTIRGQTILKASRHAYDWL